MFGKKIFTAVVLAAAVSGSPALSQIYFLPQNEIDGRPIVARPRDLPDDYFPPEADTTIPTEKIVGAFLCLSDEEFDAAKNLADAVRSAERLLISETDAQFGGLFGSLTFKKTYELIDRMFFERITTYTYSRETEEIVRARRFDPSTLKPTDIVVNEQLVLLNSGDLWIMSFGAPEPAPFQSDPVYYPKGRIEHLTCFAP